MTPSEIAEWLDGVSDDVGGYGWVETCGNLSKAATTIRELEAKSKEWVEPVVKLACNHAKSEAKLKIATEALGRICEADDGYPRIARRALARIEGVG